MIKSIHQLLFWKRDNGSDNPAAKSQGIKQLMAGGGVVLIGLQLIPLHGHFPLIQFMGR